MDVPQAWVDDAPELRGVLPAGRVLAVTERWLGSTKKHVYQLDIEVQRSDAFTVLAAEAKRVTGKKPQWMRDQRKLTFYVGDWFYLAFGGDGEAVLKLMLSKSCDEAVYRVGATGLTRALDTSGKFPASTAINVTRWVRHDGASGGSAEFPAEDPEARAAALRAEHPTLEITTRSEIVRLMWNQPDAFYPSGP
jgi:hypothetical protein